VDIFIPLFIGMIIGIILTYISLQQKHRRKILKLERIITNHQSEIQEWENKYNTLQQSEEKVINSNNSISPTNTNGHLSQNFSIIETKNNIVNERENTEIEEFLRTRNIQIKTLPPEQESNEVLSGIAIFMGNRYSLIQKFHERMKSSINNGIAFTINLRDDSQEKVSSICQLATRLHEIAFLEEYRYQKSPAFILRARPSKNSKVNRFISGQWLELFVKERVVQLTRSINPQRRYSYLLNPQIILPNGDDFELDVIFKIGEEIFWFEAKTGDYQRHIEKYSKISSILSLDREHSYMILTDIPDTTANSLSSLFNMTVVHVEKFAEIFEQSLNK
jgi:hypothetical protein